MKKVGYLLIGLCFFSCAFEEPYFMTIEVSQNPKIIVIDGRFTEFSAIPAAYHHKTKDLDSVHKSKFFVKLKYEKGTTVGAISDIADELKKLKISNVRYYETEELRNSYH